MGATDKKTLEVVLELRDKLTKQLEQTSNKTTKSSDAMAKSFGMVALKFAAVVVAAKAVVVVLKALGTSLLSITQKGSDLSETMSLVGVVFGENTEVMKTWAETASASLIQTQSETLKQAAMLFDMTKNLGLADEAALSMSKGLTALTADFASFRNMEAAEVFEKINAALIGSHEPMRSLGVFLSVAKVEQEALNSGIWDGVEAITSAQKTQATYNIILDEAGSALGDVERTSEGFANATRGLIAEWDTFQAKLGQFTADSPSVSFAIGSIKDAVITLTDGLVDSEDSAATFAHAISIAMLEAAAGVLTLAASIGVMTNGLIEFTLLSKQGQLRRARELAQGRDPGGILTPGELRVVGDRPAAAAREARLLEEVRALIRVQGFFDVGALNSAITGIESDISELKFRGVNPQQYQLPGNATGFDFMTSTFPAPVPVIITKDETAGETAKKVADALTLSIPRAAGDPSFGLGAQIDAADIPFSDAWWASMPAGNVKEATSEWGRAIQGNITSSDDLGISVMRAGQEVETFADVLIAQTSRLADDLGLINAINAIPGRADKLQDFLNSGGQFLPLQTQVEVFGSAKPDIGLGADGCITYADGSKA